MKELDANNKADRELKRLAIYCLFTGSLVLVAASAICSNPSLSHFLHLSEVPMKVSTYKVYMQAYVIAVGWILPNLGLLLLFVAYRIWKYLDARGTI